MHKYQIQTAHNVAIKQDLAHIGVRILATLIDIAILTVFYFILFVSVFAQMFQGDGAGWAMQLLFTLPMLLYHFLFEVFMNGQSPGKKAMKIKVVLENGNRPALSNYLVRWILRMIDISISFGSVAMISIIITKKAQRLGDLAGKTVVIHDRRNASLSQTLMIELPDNYNPRYPQVTIFNDADMQKVKSIFTRALHRGDHKVILKLHDQLKEKMQVSPTESPLEFCKIVLYDYNFYTQQ